MFNTDAGAATAVILEATRRPDLGDAIAWLAEDQPMHSGTNWSELLRALVAVTGTGTVETAALRRVVKEAARSEVDTSKVVFDHNHLPKPADFKEALDELRARSVDGKLASLTPRDVMRAQYANSRTIQTLCLAAGVSYSDAKDWFRVPADDWTSGQVKQLLDYLSGVLDCVVQSPIPKSTPAKAVELMFAQESGWSAVDSYVANGVPYEVLLTQRAVGGVWLQHKNATSSFPNIAAADALCEKLDARGIDYRRAKTVGGPVKQADLQHLSKIPKKQVGLVVVNSDGVAKFAVTFSSARDGGTARANGDGLIQIPVTGLPLALLLTGLGWAMRPETDRLARRFSGLLFTEQNLDDLATCIEAAVSC